MPTKLSTIEIDMTRLEDALRQAEDKLDANDYAILRAVVDAYDTIAELVDDKNTTIARLRKLLFGSRTEKTKTVIGGGKDSESLRSASAAVSTAVVAATEKGVLAASVKKLLTGGGRVAREVSGSAEPG
jgi:hypothetical protein